MLQKPRNRDAIADKAIGMGMSDSFPSRIMNSEPLLGISLRNFGRFLSYNFRVSHVCLV